MCIPATADIIVAEVRHLDCLFRLEKATVMVYFAVKKVVGVARARLKCFVGVNQKIIGQNSTAGEGTMGGGSSLPTPSLTEDSPGLTALVTHPNVDFQLHRSKVGGFCHFDLPAQLR